VFYRPKRKQDSLCYTLRIMTYCGDIMLLRRIFGSHDVRNRRCQSDCWESNIYAACRHMPTDDHDVWDDNDDGCLCTQEDITKEPRHRRR